MLGFDALGRLALGQLPRIQAPLPFGKWEQPLVLTKSAASLAATSKGFVAPPKVTTSVFSTFSQPMAVRPPQATQPTLIQQTTVAATATPTALVFSSFSQPSFKPVRADPDVNFRVLRPDSATPTALVFPSFSLPQAKPAIQSGFTNAPIVLATQPTIFSKFSEPSKTTFKNSDVSNVPVFITPTVVVQPYVFSTFSQPSIKTVPQADRLFVGDRGPAQTPIWSTFSQFKELLTKKPQQDPSVGFIGDRGPAQNPLYLAFSDFEGIPSRRPLDGYITSASLPAVQNFVFSKFDQPVYKRIIQPDTSFVNFPVVVAAVQPYVFSDFGQPQQTKRPVIDDRSFLNFPVVVVQQQPYIFSPFEQPRPTRPVSFAGFTSNTPEFVQAVVQNYTFGSFSQPQLIRPRVDGFTNTPDFLTIQPYVFTSFDQPRQSKLIAPGFTNNLAFIAPQVYVFSRFEQPISNRQLQIDSVQFVDNNPTVVVLSPDFSYSDFGLPFYTKQTGISFTNSPLQPIVAPDNSAPFNGFCSFILNLPGRFSVEQHPGVAYEILVPEVVVEDTGFAGKYWKVKPYVAPKAIQVESSTISEVVFDKASNELKVKFNSGREYNYTNISEKKVKGLIKAKSSGKYLHNNIKGKYFTTRTK